MSENNIDIRQGFERRNKLKFKISAICSAVIIAIFAVIIAIDVIFPIRYYASVKKYCHDFGVSPSAVLAVIWTESKFSPTAKSGAGACGLMQMMPSTAQWLSEILNEQYSDEKLFEPDYNIKLGVYYLSYLQKNFEGDYVYAAYNAGEGNVRKWLSGDGVIDFPETRIYLKKIKFVRGLYKLRVNDSV